MYPPINPAQVLLFGCVVAVIGPAWHLILRLVKKADPAKVRKHEIAAHTVVVLAALLILVGTALATEWPGPAPVDLPRHYETPAGNFTQLANGG